jgi:hypothetical protein
VAHSFGGSSSGLFFERRKLELLSFSFISANLLAVRTTRESRMARPEGKSSNSLVDALIGWGEHLEAA